MTFIPSLLDLFGLGMLLTEHFDRNETQTKEEGQQRAEGSRQLAGKRKHSHRQPLGHHKVTFKPVLNIF